MKLKHPAKLNFLYPILIILFSFLTNKTLLAQMSHQELLDALSKKIENLQSKLVELKQVPQREKTNIVDNTGLIENIQNSINSLEKKIDGIKEKREVNNSLERKSLEHLSNIESDINKLVKFKVKENEEKNNSAGEAKVTGEEIESENKIEFAVGTGFVSRYVWRGNDFGDSPSIQPYISATYFGVTLGTWASYPFSTESSGSNEHDLFLSYNHTSAIGSFGITLTDFYYPNAGIGFSKWEGDGRGAHTIELSLSYSGPINTLLAYNIHNDPDKSFYLELGYSLDISGMPVDLFVAGAKGKSTWYGISTDKVEINNVGLKGSKDILISDKFSLNVSASYIINPYAKKTFLVFGISL